MATEIIKPVPHLIKDAMSNYEHKTALMYPVKGKYERLTYREMGEEIKKFAKGLIDLGLDEKMIAIDSENRPEWPISEYAVMSSKGLFVPVYEKQTKDYVAYVLNDSGASAVIVSNPEEFEKISDVRNDAPDLEYVITMNGEKDYRKNIIPFDEIKSLGVSEESDKFNELFNSINLETPAKIIYTSGTTGEPKGALFDHLAISYNALASIDRLGFNKDDVSISYLPLAHSFEANNQNVVLFSGGTIAYSDRKDLKENMLKAKPTVLPGVPVVFQKIYKSIPEFGKDALKKYIERLKDNKNPGIVSKFKVGMVRHGMPLIKPGLKKKTGGRIKFFISGGAALDPKISEYFEQLKLPTAEGYGLTEFCPVVAVNDPENIKHGYVGRPLDLEIEDERGNVHGPVEVKVAGDGELLVRGPSTMKKYWKKPGLTKETLKDGWLYTGDLAEISDEGYIKITGRKKEMAVLSTGENVPLVMVENFIKKGLNNINPVVYGDKMKYPVALLFPEDSGSILERESVEKHLERMNKDLPRHEQIEKFEIMKNPIPDDAWTPTQKIKRHFIEDKYRDVIKELYSSDA